MQKIGNFTVQEFLTIVHRLAKSTIKLYWLESLWVTGGWKIHGAQGGAKVATFGSNWETIVEFASVLGMDFRFEDLRIMIF